MHLMIEKGIIGGISMVQKDIKKQVTLISMITIQKKKITTSCIMTQIIYMAVAMSKPLPCSGFRWVKNR